MLNRKIKHLLKAVWDMGWRERGVGGYCNPKVEAEEGRGKTSLEELEFNNSLYAVRETKFKKDQDVFWLEGLRGRRCHSLKEGEAVF